MSRCTCPEMPACEWDWCQSPADWSVLQPPWVKLRGPRARFMCDVHFEIYHDAMTKPIKGLTKPEGADDDWRPSLIDMIRHAEIAIAFENRNRNKIPAPAQSTFPSETYWKNYEDRRGYTPAQRACAAIHRALCRKFRTGKGERK